MYLFVHDYGLTTGDAIEIPSVSSVTNFTMCCYFIPFDYGGGGTPTGGTGSYPEGFAQVIMGFDSAPATPAPVMYYMSDLGSGTARSLAVLEGGGWDDTDPRPNRGVLHSLVLVRNGTTVDFWLNGAIVFTPPAVSTSTFLMDHIRIGCKWGGSANDTFGWAQIGQWGLFTRAWSSGEVATYHAARTAAINRNSEAIWGLIGIPTTNLVDYRPMLDDVDDHSGNGRSQVVVGTPSGTPMGAKLLTAQITPGGDLLELRLGKLDTGTPAWVVEYGGGLSITKNGVTTALTDVMASAAMNVIWAPLDYNHRQVIDDDPAYANFGGGTCTLGGGGTWSANTSLWDGQSEFLYSLNDATGIVTLCLGNRWSVNGTASATATYSFPSVLPGQYDVFTIVPAHSSHTTQATYTVKDGATTIGTYPINQRTDMTFHTHNSRHRWMRLGTVTVVTGTTVTVTITNTAGAGSLAADGVMIQRKIPPFATGSDTVTVSAIPGWAVCNVNPGGAPSLQNTEVPTNFPVTLQTLAQRYPFNSSRTRLMRMGYNEGLQGDPHTRSNPIYANRCKQAFPWSGTGIGLDGNANLTANPNGAKLTVDGAPVRGVNGLDNYAYPNAAMHNVGAQAWTVKFKLESGTQTAVSLQCFDTGVIIGGVTGLTSIGGGYWQFTQSIDMRRLPSYNVGVDLVVAAGTVISDPQVYSPEVNPATHTSRFHPGLLAQYENMSLIRFVEWYQPGDQYSLIEYGDFPTPTKLGTSCLSTYREFHDLTFGPAISTDPDSPTDVSRWYSPGNGECICLVTSAAPHNLRTGDLIGNWTAEAIWPDTSTVPAMFTSLLDGLQSVVVKDSTHFFLRGHSNGNPVGGQITTLAGTHTYTGYGSIANGRGNPIEDAIALCNETNCDMWFCWPTHTSNACLSHYHAIIAATLEAGLKYHFEIGNEIWNTGFFSLNQANQLANNMQWLYDHSLPGGFPVGRGVGRAWLGQRTREVRTLARADFTTAGRSTADVLAILAVCFADSSTTGGAVNYLESVGVSDGFDEFAIAPYRDAFEYEQPAQGYAISPRDAFFRLSTASRVDALWYAAGPDGPFTGLMAAQVAALGTYSGKTRITYEGGVQTTGNRWVSPTEGLSNEIKHQCQVEDWATYSQANFFFLERAFYEYEETILLLEIDVRYTRAQPNGNGSGRMWCDNPTVFTLPGTGNPAENPNPFDFDPEAPVPWVSQVGGARRFYASETTPSPDAIVAIAVTAASSTLASTYAVATGGGGGAFWDQILTEPTAVPGPNPTVLEALAWLYTLSRNKIIQTNTAQTLKANDNTTTIATATVADDGTFNRGKFS